MEMIEFQAFDIAAWAVEGLTRHIKVASKWVATKRPKYWPASTTLASTLLVTAGALYGSTAAVTPSQPLSIAAKQLVRHFLGRYPVVGSPQQFWADIAGDMRSWKLIDESDDLEIPPFV